MRRTDEAFKNEVLRRYGVQKHNRRNYFLLALSPLVLLIVLGSLIFLPHLSKLFDLSPAERPETTVTAEITKPNDPPIEDPLSPSFDECLQTPAQSITATGVYLKKGADRLQKALQELHYTETEAFVTPLSSALSIQLEFSDADRLQLLFFSDGNVHACHTNPNKEWHFTIPQEELSALRELVNEIIAENVTDLSALVYADESAKLTFQNTTSNYTAVDVISEGLIEEVYAVFETFSGTPVDDLKKPIGSGYKFTFTYASGAKRWLTIDPEEPYICFSYQSVDGQILENAWYKVSAERWETIVTAWMFKWETAMRSAISVPAPETYLPDSYTKVTVKEGNRSHSRSRTYTIELLAVLREKLANKSPVYTPPLNNAHYEIQVESDTLHAILQLDLQTNAITVSVTFPEELANIYHFTLSKENMSDIGNAVKNFIGEIDPVDPPTVLTFADFLATKPDQISVYAQFGADQRYDAKDGTNNWFASLMEELQACEFQACAPSVNAANVGKPTIVLTKDGCSLHLLLNDQTDSIITYLYDSAGNLVDTAHYKTDNALSFGRSISWANSSMLGGNLNVNETSALRKLLSEEIKAASYRLYALQDAVFSCKNADEIQKILDCIEKMSFTEIPAVNLTCMGSIVTFTMGDGRTATFSFDDTGYLHLLVTDAGGKTITSQWYEFALKPNTSGILRCLSNLRTHSASVYPTPGNLYTELYPYAAILNLYPEYLSTYTQPSDYQIGEIMRRIHELKLTECNEPPDYVFNQPTLEFWFSNCVFRIIVDGQNGYIRTFVEEFDQTTLLVAKMYKGSVQEIAALAAYLDELTPDPPYVEELHIAPLDTFRTFLNQAIASLTLSVNNISYLPYEYTDAKVISAVLEKIKALSLTNKQEATAVGDSPNSSYVRINFANGNSMTLLFDTSGYVEYRLDDEKSGIIYAGKYRLSATEVSAFAKFIDPYLDAAPSDEVPLIKDLLGNTALQSFLAGVGVSVNTTPEETPREIERMLADYGGAVGGFFASGQSFTSPDGVNLDYMLYDYYGTDRSPLSDAERLALVKAGVHPGAIGNMEFSRYTLEEIRGILADNLAYMPAFADDLHEEMLKFTVYAPETDCYYQFHTDYLGRTSGENARLYRTDRADTVIVLFSDDFYDGLHVAAFRIVDGAYRLYGYTPLLIA